MANQKPTQFSTYLSGLLDRKLRSISLSITNGSGYLKTLMTNTQAAAVTATNALNAFEGTYIGIHATDPTTNAIGGSILLGAFYIRSTDGRFRYVSSLDGSGNPVWSDANVLPWPITPGIFTITGTGENAGVRLQNTNAAVDLRVIQKDDGHFSIMNETTSTELFSLVSGQAHVGTSLVWTATNDGSGSGLDADTMRGSNWTSGQNVSFGVTKSQTPGTGTNGGFVSIANASSGHAILQVMDSTGAVQWGYWDHTVVGNANWNGAGDLLVNGNTVWHSANDGSGSGLDADLWRGNAPSDLGFGSGQVLNNVTGSRVHDTTYTNTGTKALCVIVAIASNESSGDYSGSVIVGSITVATGIIGGQYTGHASRNITFWVPPGSTYSVNIGGGGTISNWTEIG